MNTADPEMEFSIESSAFILVPINILSESNLNARNHLRISSALPFNIAD
jgi:hypothetical protein